ncbi:MAG: homocysteine S-methyltransferase family protein [Clostridiales bacterium]|nr:homocysteine S-methyltransferase family protein [Clostridiales bacterium]
MLRDERYDTRQRLKNKLGKELLIFDGAMGSQLHARGILPGELPEDCNIDHPDWIVDIHSEYLKSGASCILTNTLGSNRFHLEDSDHSVAEVIGAAVRNGRAAIEKERVRCVREGIEKDCFLFFNIGPLGQLLAPIGTLSFEDAYEAFAEQVDLVKELVDGVLIETMSDPYEIKAAVLAVKERSNLPVLACMTYDSNGRTLTGTTPEAAVTLLEGLGVDGLGVNCSLGPKELVPVVEKILSVARKPVIVEPNAGLPVYSGGKTSYNVTVEEFATYMRGFVQSGISAFGGCCGTTPEYIRKCIEKIADVPFSLRVNPPQTRICGPSDCVRIGERTVVCGERLNPTGKKKLKQALIDHRMDEIFSEAIAQEKAGAHVLDVNVGVPGIDEAQTMTEVICGLQEIVRLPLQIDSSDAEVLEKACRIYNGKPLINSVNGKKDSMESVFPIVRKYGGVVIALTIDENGIPDRADGRVAIARKIIETAATYGIDKSDIIVDCLVLTASAQQDGALQTLEAVRRVREELGVYTVLGVSNISFGLPNRPLINKTFLAMALFAGLNVPIINPLDRELMDGIDAFEVLSAQDRDSADYIRRHAADLAAPVPGRIKDANRSDSENGSGTQETENSIDALVRSGRKDIIAPVVERELEHARPLEIINDQLIPALRVVGDLYDKGTIFLPQLISAAEAAKTAFGVLNERIISEGNSGGKGPVLLATVEGDVHDIGKNIVKVVLESYGFTVVDLGKDVSAAKIVAAVREHQPKLIGLSALMTTTVTSMKKTINELKSIPDICPIVVGGAVLTEDIAIGIGADHYAKDAMGAVAVAEKIIPEKKEG